MREHIETAELTDADLDAVSGGLLDGVANGLIGDVAALNGNHTGVDLGGITAPVTGVISGL